ncbi:tRNA pseudouridine(38/39) synthase [Nymphalis io]|uniref:tRNA pseudouridine(38/39) synthase n=1 Tax=Inachis io TaxID=171585 RepID=UPI0021678954|nr:tRNA pseudouridine(38/39) synthase [Nymphalis io]
MDRKAIKARKILKKELKKAVTKEELSQFDKDVLIDRIIALDTENTHLKNIITKRTENKANLLKPVIRKEFDYSKCHYRKILLRISYLGWDYKGFVVQDDTTETIEHHLFHALIKSRLIESREKAEYNRCGRTDKGVSSYGQVISIKVRSRYPLAEQNLSSAIAIELPYCRMLNRLLPREIRAVSWLPLPEDKIDMSARFDCKRRQYKYYFPRSSLNLQAMGEACTHLVGTHDFRNFCKMDVGNGVTVHIRQIFSAYIAPVSEKDIDGLTSMFVCIIEGNAFLWHQIRCVMGVILLVGQGLESPDIMKYLLNVEENPRKPQYNLALDVPLNLNKCVYDIDDLWIYDPLELKNIISTMQKLWTEHSVKTTLIKDFLQNLEALYNTFIGQPSGDSVIGKSDQTIAVHTDVLLQGPKPKIYKPLKKRQQCSSLEERIEYYEKKKARKSDEDVEMKT